MIYHGSILVFRQQNTRIDVFPNGQVQLRNGEIGPWVSLSGIEYHAGKIGGSLKFVNGWSNYSTTYKAASYYVDGNGICSLSGLIKGSDYRGMVLLPSNCRPDARLIMNVQAAGNGHTRVDIMPNGEVRFVRGDQGGWVSLSGIVVPVQPTASAPAPKKPLARKAPVSKTQVAAISAIAPTAFSQVQRDRLSQLSQSVQSRVERVLTSTDRRTVGQMQEEAAAIAKMRQGAARKRAVDTFNNKHARFRNDIVRRARIDDAFFLSETRKILPQHNLRRVGNVYLSTSNNRLSSSHTSEPADTPEETAQVAQSASTTLFDVESHSSGCTDYTSMVDDDDKTFSALAISYIAGGCESITSLGSNIQVPAGTSIVRVRIILDDGFLLSNAATGVAGYGQSYTEIGIRVKGPGVDEYYADSDQLVIAPVAYSADIKKEEFGNYVMEVEVSPSSSGGVYQIQAYAKSSSMGVAGGLGVGYARVGDMGLIETWFE